MELSSTGREFYSISAVTEPAVDAWEASFDNGASYVAGTLDVDTGFWSWLLAGEDAEDPDDLLAVATITKTLHPLLRDIDNPEIIVRRGPLIRYSR